MSVDTYKIIDSDGTNIRFKETESRRVLSDPQLELLEHAKLCHDHCRQLESAVEKLNAMQNEDGGCSKRVVGGYFPLIIGRRPSSTSSSTTTSTATTLSSSNNKQLQRNVKAPEIKGYIRYVYYIVI